MKPHPRIRKTIKWGGAAVTVLLVVVWLALGALTSVFVAWGSAFARPFHSPTFLAGSKVDRDDIDWAYPRAKGLDIPQSIERANRFLCEECRASWQYWSPHGENGYAMATWPTDAVAYGLPWRCLGTYEEAIIPRNLAAATTPRLASPRCWRPPVPFVGVIELPYFPIWPGFALNSIFYALFLSGILRIALAFLRRRRRARLNLCPKCNYDRAGIAKDAVCPECGEGMSARV